MSISQHAEQILIAWQDANPEQFNSELEKASKCCARQTGASIFETEQKELLESIVQSLKHRQKNLYSHPPAELHGLTAGFTLLQHLRQSVAAY